MADLVLSGQLNLKGTLHLVGEDRGKVMIGAGRLEALVEVDKGDGQAHCSDAPQVLIPPQGPGYVDDGTNVWIYKSFNRTVTANDAKIITQGLCAQGRVGLATWPGMVSASIGNQEGVTINNVAINVVNDLGITLASGASVTFSNSGQTQP